MLDSDAMALVRILDADRTRNDRTEMGRAIPISTEPRQSLPDKIRDNSVNDAERKPSRRSAFFSDPDSSLMCESFSTIRS